MSSNLRNKEFYINNKKYKKEEYFKKINEFNLGSRIVRKNLIKKFQSLQQNTIYKFANTINIVNSTGNNIFNTKNCYYCFDTKDSKDSKYCYRTLGLKDCMDFDYGISELMYEYITGALNCYNVRFSYSAIDSVHNAEYTHSCMSSTNLFGCFGLKSKENIIFNKVYSKEKFIKLRTKIINHMNEIPYIDKKGRVYKYGEFFPTEFSPFAYNEAIVQEFYPLTKTEAINRGYRWCEPNEKNYSITIATASIPDNIKDVKDTILSDVLECEHKMKYNHQCLLVFRITSDELKFYKKNNIPLPDQCPNCRYYQRFEQVLPNKLWHRKCMKEGCNNKFETPYAPNRPEKVYCESCYNKEIY